MTVGERIKLRRKELGISVDELAEKLGKNRATIYRYESEAIKKMPLDILGPIATALNTTPGVLMGWQQYEQASEYYENREVLAGLESIKDSVLSELLRMFGEVTEEGQMAIIDYATYISSQEKFQKSTYEESQQ